MFSTAVCESTVFDLIRSKGHEVYNGVEGPCAGEVPSENIALVEAVTQQVCHGSAVDGCLDEWRDRSLPAVDHDNLECSSCDELLQHVSPHELGSPDDQHPLHAVNFSLHAQRCK